MDREHKIHAFYILLILISIIIILVTVKWSEVPKLVEYISFALTVSSLTLAVLAIVYTIYSNSTFSQNIGSLERASRDVSETAQTINKITSDLANKMEAIPPLIETVGARVEITQQLIEGMSGKPVSIEEPISSKLFEQAITSFSPLGDLALYACFIASKNNVAFNLEELCNNVEGFKWYCDYIFGFLVGVSSFKVFNFSLHKGVANVSNFDEKLGNLIKPQFETIRKDDKIGQLVKSNIEKGIEEIEAFLT